MKTITLRNLPEHVAELIRERAERDRTSLTKTVIRLLEERLQMDHSVLPPKHHDLDHLAGAWSEADADEFDRNLQRQRTIDPELWR